MTRPRILAIMGSGETAPTMKTPHRRIFERLAASAPVRRESEKMRTAAAGDLAISVSGGRHAMGGQPFARGALHVDSGGLARVLEFDARRGLLRVEAGMQWPELLAALRQLQPGGRRWGLRQKQTGADHLSVGGALSANVHGRGLGLAPFAADVESCVIVDAQGRIQNVLAAMARCSLKLMALAQQSAGLSIDGRANLG